MMQSALLFTVLFLSLFGPKVGILDFIAIGGLAGLLLVYNRRKIVFPKELAVFASILTIYTFYSLLVVILSRSSNTYVVLRCVRMLLSTLLLGIIFSNVNLPLKRLINILIFLLFLNACTVIAEVAFPEIRQYLSALYDVKVLNPLRVSGLTSGYDGAGFLSVIGAAMSGIVLVYLQPFKLWHLLALLLFASSTIFNSRVTMVAAFVVVLLTNCMMIWRGRGLRRPAALACIVLMGTVFITMVLPLLLKTQQYIDVSSEILPAANSVEAFDSSYTHYTYDYWVEMWRLPTDVRTVIFGGGTDPEFNDVGYFKVIYMTGFVGLAVIFLAYGYLIVRIRRCRRVLNRLARYRIDTTPETLTATAITSVIFLVFVLDLKNFYFLSRSVHELIVILFFALMASVKTKLASAQQPHALT